MMRWFKLSAATLAVSLIGGSAWSGSGHSGELTGTLKKIRGSGKIILGVRAASLPFSYLDENRHYQGYSIDICLKIADSVKKKLALPDLKVIMNPVTSASRIPLLTNGAIDLECGSTSNTPERQAQVDFAPTTFIAGARLIAKKSSNIVRLSDLKNKTVASTSGTAALRQLTKLNAEQQLGLKIIPGKDHSEGFWMMDTGRAAAFAMDDILLAGLAATSPNPHSYSITRESLTTESYAIMLRAADPEFKHLVDAAVHALLSSGEIAAIYDKWFTRPIPPGGINLNRPMSPELKNVLDQPTATDELSILSWL